MTVVIVVIMVACVNVYTCVYFATVYFLFVSMVLVLMAEVVKMMIKYFSG